MSRRYDFKDSSGNTVIPVADDSFYTDLMSVTPDEIDVYFAFYSDSSGETPVSPTSGTISTHGEYLDGFFLAASTNATINASEVTTPDGIYTPPSIFGCSIRARIDLLNVDAPYMRAFAYKRN